MHVAALRTFIRKILLTEFGPRAGYLDELDVEEGHEPPGPPDLEQIDREGDGDDYDVLGHPKSKTESEEKLRLPKGPNSRSGMK